MSISRSVFSRNSKSNERTLNIMRPVRPVLQWKQESNGHSNHGHKN